MRPNQQRKRQEEKITSKHIPTDKIAHRKQKETGQP